ncbi:unnamed protein product [Rotaria magnacalcarata]|uniref:NACHT domain-containing protein n=1 Tax=Rotaria magnacalcarata TaxID=392030 RepID=A0A819P946_9BILA|nr:unnamed protein product [Rotaria magnacalcarata]CAF4006187.1 unnamed protein product [Rotaria magnacalcarata]
MADPISVIATTASAFTTLYTVITTIIEFIDTVEENKQHAKQLIKRVERFQKIIENYTKDDGHLLDHMQRILEKAYEYALQFKKDQYISLFSKEKGQHHSHVAKNNAIVPVEDPLQDKSTVIRNTEEVSQRPLVDAQNSCTCTCTSPNIFSRFWQKSRIYRCYKSIKADLERLDKEIDRAGGDATFGILIDVHNKVTVIEEKIDTVIKGHKEIVAALTNGHSSSSKNIIDEQKLRIINKLKHEYTSRYGKIKRLMTNTFVPIDEENYINLAIIHKEQKESNISKQSEFDYSTYELIYGSKISIKITELFDKCKDKLTKRALVLGPPGIGKTTFCQYIAYKWSKYELFQQFKCLIYIRLRNLTSKLYPLRSSESYSLTDIIERECFRTYPLENHEERNVLKHMLDDASNVLWLLDGYDELNVPDHLDWFMRELLDKQIEILTSRPTTTVPYPYDVYLDITGFTDENIHDYIRKFFKTKSREGTRLISFLQSALNIWGISHIPITLEIVCTLWNEHDRKELDQITTMTALYDDMITWILRKYLSKILGDEVTNSKSNKTIYKECETVLLVLEKIAFSCMKTNSLMIDYKIIRKEVEDCKGSKNEDDLRSNVINVGLLVALDSEKIIDEEKDYYFIHLSFQEFLAARYLRRWLESYPNEAKLFLKKYKYNPQYQLMLTFTAGLLTENYVETFFDLIEDESTDLVGARHFIVLIGCLEEINRNEHRKIADRILDHIGRYLEMLISYLHSSDLWIDKNIYRMLGRSYGILCEKTIEKIFLKNLIDDKAKYKALSTIDELKNCSSNVLTKAFSMLEDHRQWTVCGTICNLIASSTSANVVREFVRSTDKKWEEQFISAIGWWIDNIIDSMPYSLGEAAEAINQLSEISSVDIANMIRKLTIILCKKNFRRFNGFKKSIIHGDGFTFDPSILNSLNETLKNLFENFLLKFLLSEDRELALEAALLLKIVTIYLNPDGRNQSYIFNCYDHIDETALLSQIINVEEGQIKEALYIFLSFQIKRDGVKSEIFQLFNETFLEQDRLSSSSSKITLALLIGDCICKTKDYLNMIDTETIDQLLNIYIEILDQLENFDLFHLRQKYALLTYFDILKNKTKQQEKVLFKIRDIIRNESDEYIVMEAISILPNLEEKRIFQYEKINILLDKPHSYVYYDTEIKHVELVKKFFETLGNDVDLTPLENAIIDMKDTETISRATSVLYELNRVNDKFLYRLLQLLRSNRSDEKKTLTIKTLEIFKETAARLDIAEELLTIIKQHSIPLYPNDYLVFPGCCYNLFILIWSYISDPKILHWILSLYEVPETRSRAAKLLQALGSKVRTSDILEQFIKHMKRNFTNENAYAFCYFCSNLRSAKNLNRLFEVAKNDDDNDDVKELIKNELFGLFSGNSFQFSLLNYDSVTLKVDSDSISYFDDEAINSYIKSVVIKRALVYDLCRVYVRTENIQFIDHIYRNAKANSIAITYDTENRCLVLHENNKKSEIQMENESLVRILKKRFYTLRNECFGRAPSDDTNIVEV